MKKSLEKGCSLTLAFIWDASNAGRLKSDYQDGKVYVMAITPIS